ncbi:MAG: helix-turn-helix domain-containing protein [Steroidobacteraceae bacterium]
MTSRARIIEAEDRELVPLNLVRAYDWFLSAVEANVAAVGGTLASRAEMLVLLWVSAGEHRANRLAQKLAVSRQAVHLLINQLVERNVLRVRPDPADKRAMIVEFAAEEIPHHDRIATLVRRLEGVLASRLGKKNVGTLRKVLAADWGDIPDLTPRHDGRAVARSKRPRSKPRLRRKT